MLSLIEVKCPHCGAHGQIMLPPVGTIIIGPCPECQGLVVVFCGHVLPLAKEVMARGSIAEKRDHLLSVLTQFIRERVELMIAEESASDEAGTPTDSETEQGTSSTNVGATESKPQRIVHAPITDEEMQAFSRIELKRLDDSNYFKTIFN